MPSSSVDSRYWSMEPLGSFSVASLCKSCSPTSMPTNIYQAIWKTNCRKKVCFFIWIIIYGKLNIADVLQKKLSASCLLPSICMLCEASGESAAHLFFHCPYASKRWCFLFKEFKLSWAFNDVVVDNVTQLLLGSNLSPQGRLFWLNAINALLRVMG